MVQDGNVLLHPDALHSLKRKQLISLCRRFGIRVIGTNEDLVERLQEYVAINIPTNSPTKGNVALLRHVKRSRSESSLETSDDESAVQHTYTPSRCVPLTPRTRRTRVSDLVQAIEQVKADTQDMDLDDQEDDQADRHPKIEPLRFSQRAPNPESKKIVSSQSTQPLRIIKALPSTSRLPSSMSAASVIELARSESTMSSGLNTASRLYPDASLLPLPEGVSTDQIVSSSTLPSISSRQFSAAAASVLTEMNARLAAAGRITGSTSVSTLGDFKTLASSSSLRDTGMPKSQSGRYEIHHDRQFKNMDSIVTHYAARRVAPPGLASSHSRSRMPASSTTTNALRRGRVDASTSTRSLAAMAGSKNTNRPAPRSRPLPPVPSHTRPNLSNGAEQQPSTKKIRLAVTEDHDALQNTVIEIPKEKNVVIKVTRPDREGAPYKFSITPSESTRTLEPSTSIRKSVIKATKSTFGSVKKTRTEPSKSLSSRHGAVGAAAAKQQSMKRSLSSKTDVKTAATEDAVSVHNRFTGLVTPSASVPLNSKNTQSSARATASVPVYDTGRKASAQSTQSTATAASAATTKTTSTSTSMSSSLRSSISAGLERTEAARQARLREIKARTRSALVGLGIHKEETGSVESGSTTPQHFSPSVTRPTVASLGRANSPMHANSVSRTAGSPSLPAFAFGSLSLMMNSNCEKQPLMQRAATIHGALMPTLPSRSSSLRHLRRMMRKQNKEAQIEQDRIAAAENIDPNTVIPSVCPKSVVSSSPDKPSIRAVFDNSTPLQRKFPAPTGPRFPPSNYVRRRT